MDRATGGPGTGADGTARTAIAPGTAIALVADAGSPVEDAGTPTTASGAGTGAGTEIGTEIGTEAPIRIKPRRQRSRSYRTSPCPSGFPRRRMPSKRSSNTIPE